MVLTANPIQFDKWTQFSNVKVDWNHDTNGAKSIVSEEHLLTIREVFPFVFDALLSLPLSGRQSSSVWLADRLYFTIKLFDLKRETKTNFYFKKPLYNLSWLKSGKIIENWISYRISCERRKKLFQESKQFNFLDEITLYNHHGGHIHVLAIYVLGMIYGFQANR